MLISEGKKIIFVHIYKNAGTSITRALAPYAMSRARMKLIEIAEKYRGPSGKLYPDEFGSHLKAAEIREKIGQQRYKTYYSFAVVRNPWDWQVSLYRYMLKSVDHRQHETVKAFGSFDAYIEWRCNKEVRLQKEFVCDETGNIIVDKLMRYETLSEDFSNFCSQRGIIADLPRLNSSKPTNYRSFYNKRTRSLVEEAFREDFELLNYS